MFPETHAMLRIGDVDSLGDRSRPACAIGAEYNKVLRFRNECN